MSSTAAAPAPFDQSEQIVLSRLWWVGPLAVIASAAANLIVRLIALALLNIPPHFRPLDIPGPTVSLTIIGVTGAVIVFAVVSRLARRPIRIFRVIALVVLLLSFLPDLRMLAIPNVGAQAVGTLMFMHIVAAAISVGMLTTLVREK